jgi:hypothetical protein
MDFPNLKGVWGNPSYLTNGDAAVDLSRSELQNTRFCAGRGVLAGLSGWPTAHCPRSPFTITALPSQLDNLMFILYP